MTKKELLINSIKPGSKIEFTYNGTCRVGFVHMRESKKRVEFHGGFNLLSNVDIYNCANIKILRNGCEE